MKNVYSVGQVNTYIKRMFSQDLLLQFIMVRGEVGGCKYHTSGHIYFTLKDASGTLSCIMFAGRRRGLSFPMREGDQVICAGTIDVYERDGRYQLYADRIIRDGVGALYEQYELLKRELEEQGMFDPQYKRPIPAYIRTLGVVTAPTGAAVRDIIDVSLRRDPYLRIILYPALVQGTDAPESIVRGIRALEEMDVDVMIVGRGGGSIEDLWAFNDVRVAQAVFDCRVPVISAVGHETDTVITDFVADLRAPTPSAAAELAVFDYMRFAADLGAMSSGLTDAMGRRLSAARERAERLSRELAHLSPQQRLRDRRMTVASLEERLARRMADVLTARRHTLELTAARLEQLSPLKRLAGGYAFLSDEHDAAVTSAAQLTEGQSLKIRMKDGGAMARVEEIWKNGT